MISETIVLRTYTAYPPSSASHIPIPVLSFFSTLFLFIPSLPPSLSLPQDLKGLFREAQMNNAVLFFDECEVVFRTRNQGGDRLLNR